MLRRFILLLLSLLLSQHSVALGVLASARNLCAKILDFPRLRFLWHGPVAGVHIAVGDVVAGDERRRIEREGCCLSSFEVFWIEMCSQKEHSFPLLGVNICTRF